MHSNKFVYDKIQECANLISQTLHQDHKYEEMLDDISKETKTTSLF